MTAVMREVTWGGGLVVETFGVAGGLRRIVDVIRQEVGPHIGVRNTFAKLYNVTDPDLLDERDQFRAWLLLSALGQDATEWGIDLTVVPRSVDASALRARLAAACPRQDSNLRPTRYEFDGILHRFASMANLGLAG